MMVATGTVVLKACRGGGYNNPTHSQGTHESIFCLSLTGQPPWNETKFGQSGS